MNEHRKDGGDSENDLKISGGGSAVTLISHKCPDKWITEQESKLHYVFMSGTVHWRCHFLLPWPLFYLPWSTPAGHPPVSIGVIIQQVTVLKSILCTCLKLYLYATSIFLHRGASPFLFTQFNLHVSWGQEGQGSLFVLFFFSFPQVFQQRIHFGFIWVGSFLAPWRLSPFSFPDLEEAPHCPLSELNPLCPLCEVFTGTCCHSEGTTAWTIGGGTCGDYLYTLS